MASAPEVLCLEGDGLTGNAKACLGFYRLEVGRKVNKRPVWRHASGEDRYIAADNKKTQKYCDDKYTKSNQDPKRRACTPVDDYCVCE